MRIKAFVSAVKSEDSKLRKAGYKLENVYAPPVGTAMLMPGLGSSHQKLMKKYRYYASIEVALRDEPSGRVSSNAAGKMTIKKKLTDSDRAKASGGLQVVRELFEAAGAREIIPCDQGFGLHLMGGCALRRRRAHIGRRS